MRPDARWALAWVPLALLVGGGCTLPLSFQNRVDAGPSNNGQGGSGSGADAGPDTPVLGVGGNGIGGSGGGNGIGGNGSGGNGSGGAPIDAPVDNRDAPIDMPRVDVPIDVPRDLPRDNGVDAGPVVCTLPADCKLAGLTCLIASGQPGRCVECVGNGDCNSNVNGRFCDPNSNRCVECLVAATDCPVTTGTNSSEHGSTCTQSKKCLNGCSDDTTQSLVCPTKPVSFTCATASGGTGLDVCVYCMVDATCGTGGHCVENVCVKCLTASDCATATPLCDPLAGRCVQCRDSRDCKTAGFPLCNPSTLTCVAVP